ncbi:phosphodiester glycosidase family protein [bacterium]|nr:phosphodiester glycosidase family protein [bacterium]
MKISFVTSVIFLVIFTACGTDAEAPTTTPKETEASPVPTETQSEPTPAEPVEEPMQLINTCWLFRCFPFDDGLGQEIGVDQENDEPTIIGGCNGHETVSVIEDDFRWPNQYKHMDGYWKKCECNTYEQKNQRICEWTVQPELQDPVEESTTDLPGRILDNECPAPNPWNFNHRRIIDAFVNNPQQLHEGVYYGEYPIGDPWIHTFKMDLNNIDLYVTPNKPTMMTSTFLATASTIFEEPGLTLDIAVNGNGFDENSPHKPNGPHISNFNVHQWKPDHVPDSHPALVVYGDGFVDMCKANEFDDDCQFDEQEHIRSDIKYAVGGYPHFIRDGSIVKRYTDFSEGGKVEIITPDARTSVGVDHEENVLILIVVEGDDSERTGLSYARLACLLYLHGATEALNLDGGSSTTLVTRDGLIIDDPDDDVDLIVNSNGNHPYPAAVKNHLGIKFKKSQTSSRVVVT